MPSFNLADLFELVVDAVPQRTALIAGDIRYTYLELEQRANRLANHLQSQGICAGDKIGIYAYNRAEWVEALWASFKIRAVPININYRYVDDELRYIADNADLVAMVYERSFTPRIATIRPDLPLLRHFIVLEDDGLEEQTIEDEVAYEHALATASESRDFGARSSDDLYMLYTGGTTGLPKGTMWRHEDILYAALQGGNPGGNPIATPEQIAALAQANTTPYKVLCPAPMMHGGGEWYCMIFMLSANTFALYCNHQFDAHKLLSLVESEGIGSMILVGDAMARPVVDALNSHHYDTSTLFALGSGGAMLTRPVKNQLKALLPNTSIMDSFGASETGSGGAVLDMNSAAAGPRFTLAENTAILDDRLRPIPPGSPETGRLARCGHIPLGYYKDEIKTAQTFQTDDKGTRWVIPGDYARVLADGTAELLGRGSGCINSGGEKIYPEEVEEALKSHPAVYDCGVLGVPDVRFGAKVVAVVKLREKQRLNTELLDRHCRERIAAYKVPRIYLAVSEIPRTPAEKLDYRRLQSLVEQLLAKEA